MGKQSDVNTERRVFRTQRGFEVSLLPKRILSVMAPARTKLYSIVRREDFRLWTEPFLRILGGR
jgi:hypothetical protein